MCGQLICYVCCAGDAAFMHAYTPGTGGGGGGIQSNWWPPSRRVSVILRKAVKGKVLCPEVFGVRTRHWGRQPLTTLITTHALPAQPRKSRAK